MDLSSSFCNASLRSKKGEKKYADFCWSGTWARRPTSQDPPEVAVLRNVALEAADPNAAHRLLASGLGFLAELSAPGPRGKGHPQAERVSELCNPNLVQAEEASVPSEPCPGSCSRR